MVLSAKFKSLRTFVWFIPWLPLLLPGTFGPCSSTRPRIDPPIFRCVLEVLRFDSEPGGTSLKTEATPYLPSCEAVTQTLLPSEDRRLHGVEERMRTSCGQLVVRYALRVNPRTWTEGGHRDIAFKPKGCSHCGKTHVIHHHQTNPPTSQKQLLSAKMIPTSP